MIRSKNACKYYSLVSHPVERYLSARFAVYRRTRPNCSSSVGLLVARYCRTFAMATYVMPVALTNQSPSSM